MDANAKYSKKNKIRSRLGVNCVSCLDLSVKNKYAMIGGDRGGEGGVLLFSFWFSSLRGQATALIITEIYSVSCSKLKQVRERMSSIFVRFENTCIV